MSRPRQPVPKRDLFNETFVLRRFHNLTKRAALFVPRLQQLESPHKYAASNSGSQNACKARKGGTSTAAQSVSGRELGGRRTNAWLAAPADRQGGRGFSYSSE